LNRSPYWFEEDDTGPGRPVAVETLVAGAESKLEPVWSRLDPWCGADRSIPTAVAIRLDRRFNTDSNSFSAERLRNQFGNHLHTDIAGRTCVEIGPGAHNPYALLILLALLGARRAIGIEPAPTYDDEVAAVGAARAAGFLLTAPHLIAGDVPVDRRAVLARAEQFDFGKLWAGDLTGLAGSAVDLLHTSVYDTGLDTGSVDYLFSNSTLEHLARPSAGVAEIARITARGGTSKHFIDGIDHNAYVTAGVDPLGFLDLDTPHPLVNGSNRVRPLTFRDLFVEHGFETITCTIAESAPVDDRARSRMADPWRSMPQEYLQARKAFLDMRRTGDG
jgi:hypothetical protein